EGRKKQAPCPGCEVARKPGRGEFFSALSYSTDFAPECDNRARFAFITCIQSAGDTKECGNESRLIAQNRRRCEPLPRWIGRAPRRAEARRRRARGGAGRSAARRADRSGGRDRPARPLRLPGDGRLGGASLFRLRDRRVAARNSGRELAGGRVGSERRALSRVAGWR